MTRFLYIADTHLGATPMGYQQQRGYPEKLPEIMRALRDYVLDDGGIDFILHGGDLVDTASAANIKAAVDIFDLPVPVYLCLGNHDLTCPNAVGQWLQLAPAFFPGGAPDYTIATDDCQIHVAPNHWCETPHLWEGEQHPRLSADQRERLTHALNCRTGLPQIVVTHSPVHGVPPPQTGFSEPYHYPGDSFFSQITTLVAEHAGVCCVLGAHSHVNMRLSRAGVDYVTVSSLAEMPFEFKRFEVTRQRVSMSTVSLATAVDFAGVYDSGKSFVQGRPDDRAFSRAL